MAFLTRALSTLAPTQIGTETRRTIVVLSGHFFKIRYLNMDFKTTRRIPAGASAATKRPLTSLSARDKRALIHGGDQHRQFGGSDVTQLSVRYSHPLNFYDELPGCNIGLMDFETLALERLKVLRIMEKVASLSVVKFSAEWAEKVDAELRQGNSGSLAGYSYNGLEKDISNRERDHFSHYILRLAYCKSEELRRWFVMQECDLFRYRCIMAGCLKDFIEVNELSYLPVPAEEMNDIRSLLFGLIFKASGVLPPTSFYKVPFTEALDLVRTRRVYLHGGMCYVPDTEMVSLVGWIFKSMLSQGLIYTYKVLPNLDEDERLLKVLGDLDRRYTGADYAAQDGDDLSVRPEMIRPLAEKSFPMCMRSMQYALNTTHHLKYKARLQYGLFLKGIGLSLEDAIKFFRGEFAQSHIDIDKFDKEYTYGIRYNYGKEGKKVNWTPWNCMRIIMDSVGPGENHGCPYRHHDPDLLRELLVKSGIEGDNLKEILQLSKDGHYQKACGLQFKVSHAGAEISTVMTNHPNQFYLESIGGGVTGTSAKSKVKTEKACLYEKVPSSAD